VIAPSRGAAYRRFYLYSALSVAVIAIAVAAAILLRLLLSTGRGLGPTADETSRNISLAVALLGIAVPVGAAHLWLIVRSFADPAERAAVVRHQYLNLWLAFALLVVLFAGQAAIAAQVPNQADVTIQVSVLVIAAIVGAVAAWWISRTPPASPQARIRSAVVVMLVSMAVAAFSVANAASGAGGIWQNARLPIAPIDPAIIRGPNVNVSTLSRLYQEGAFRSGLLTTGLALTVWSFAFSWQRRWADSRDRLGYALLGYGAGVTALLIGLAFGIAGAIRLVGDPAQLGAFISAWPAIAAGAVLVAVHVTLLLLDRGRNGHPPVTTTRLLLAQPALVGLGMIVGGLAFAAHALVERDVVAPNHLSDDLTQALSLLTIGLVAYAGSWLAFDARTSAGSAVRRFYLFTVVCLSLVAGLISGVIVLYSAITGLAGVGDDAARTAITWFVPAVTLAVLFGTHLALLLGDQRATRSVEPAAPADPLLVLLEEVRAGRVSVDRAAATIRGPLA
jgi:hypothetical protein